MRVKKKSNDRLRLVKSFYRSPAACQSLLAARSWRAWAVSHLCLTCLAMLTAGRFLLTLRIVTHHLVSILKATPIAAERPSSWIIGIGIRLRLAKANNQEKPKENLITPDKTPGPIRSSWGDGEPPKDKGGAALQHLCGRDWLTNHEINFVTAVASSALCGMAGERIFFALEEALGQPEFL